MKRDNDQGNNRQAGTDDFKRQHQDRSKPQSKYNDYHELTMSIDDIYHEISDRKYLRHPDPMRSSQTKRNQNKYCRFHGEHEHTTLECIDVKDKIERLIRDRRLQQYRADRRGNNRNNDQ